jgi:hypothetical protein
MLFPGTSEPAPMIKLAFALTVVMPRSSDVSPALSFVFLHGYRILDKGRLCTRNEQGAGIFRRVASLQKESLSGVVRREFCLPSSHLRRLVDCGDRNQRLRARL